jgi:hypothetical protein
MAKFYQPQANIERAAPINQKVERLQSPHERGNCTPTSLKTRNGVEIQVTAFGKTTLGEPPQSTGCA